MPSIFLLSSIYICEYLYVLKSECKYLYAFSARRFLNFSLSHSLLRFLSNDSMSPNEAKGRYYHVGHNLQDLECNLIKPLF